MVKAFIDGSHSTFVLANSLKKLVSRLKSVVKNILCKLKASLCTQKKIALNTQKVRNILLNQIDDLWIKKLNLRKDPRKSVMFKNSEAGK